jgi:glycosyltransferase involved in cell wall biosynthesis
MNTGGTPDIVKHEETGLLSSTPEALAADVRRLVDDPTRRRQLGDAARDHAVRTFAANTVVQRVESLYMDLLSSTQKRTR